MSRPVDPLDAPLTAEEVGTIARLAPQYVRTDEAGRLVPLRTRREIVALQFRFPSMDPTRAAPPARTGNREADVLRARYPTMHQGKP